MTRSRPPHVLVRSAWQTENIGDIAHTPGILRLLQRHVPEAAVTLWPSDVSHGVDALLQRTFPQLQIALPGSPEWERAWHDCDFLLHGSGAAIVGEDDLLRWHQSGKPFGLYGISFSLQHSWETFLRSPRALAQSVDVLNQARFAFFRDTPSLDLAQRLGASANHTGFAPDAAFACDLRDDARADAFLAAHGLAPQRFLCCIPRLRYTPYWEIKADTPFDPDRHARNEEMKEHDHVLLREAICAVVRQTDLHVLVCAEDQTQVALGKTLLVDPLPKAVRARVVWRPDYWHTGEATSVYARSAGLFGNEMHSPILCIAHGVPAIVCRFTEQTTKGLMWADIGLSEWLFDLDNEADRARLPDTVLRLAQEPVAARAQVAAAQVIVAREQHHAMNLLRAALGLPVRGAAPSSARPQRKAHARR